MPRPWVERTISSKYLPVPGFFEWMVSWLPKTDAVAEGDVAAELAEVTFDGTKAVAGFKRVDDVVAGEVFAFGVARALRGGGDDGLGGKGGDEETEGEERSHRRKLALALEPWILTWQVVQFW